jgi:O-methyltransferase involved in polyketide biosynthesis
VFDYSEPLENYPPARRQRIAAMAKQVEAMGEPWLTHFDPASLARDLSAIGFTEQEDLGPHEMAIRFYGVPENEAPTGAGPRVIRARQRPEAATRAP